LPGIICEGKKVIQTQQIGQPIDDFIGAAVKSKDGTLLGRMSRCMMMHGIRAVVRPPNITSHTGGKDQVSINKLEHGGGQWHHK
jgi:hypothetical protein